MKIMYALEVGLLIAAYAWKRRKENLHVWNNQHNLDESWWTEGGSNWDQDWFLFHFEVGAQIFFRQKKWQFFHQKWWFSRWITENGDNIGEGTGDIFSDCWKSWNSCHNYCHLFWWQYCHQIWWRFFHRKWWLSKWITVKGEKSGERKGDVLGEC